VDLIWGFAKFVPLQINQAEIRNIESRIINRRFLPPDLIP